MSLHMRCTECNFLDIILQENGKAWKCPNCEFNKASPIKQSEFRVAKQIRTALKLDN